MKSNTQTSRNLLKFIFLLPGVACIVRGCFLKLVSFTTKSLIVCYRLMLKSLFLSITTYRSLILLIKVLWFDNKYKS
nr:unnamed protein product [Callosobruchus chinensis]